MLGVRPDGYHELRTTFQSIALADALTFTRVPGPFRIVCDDPDCPADSRNLVWRAAELLWRAARRAGAPRDVVVTIAKRIPIQAGLGGGSSDAAAALTALASLWRIRLTRARLRGLASAIGADVPYFLEGGTALGRARGDRLSRLHDIPRAWVVLIVPRFGVSTAEAFGWWDTQERRSSRIADRHGRAGITNDLQRVVVAASSRSCPGWSRRSNARRVSRVVIGQRIRRIRSVQAPGARRARRAERCAAPARAALVLVTRTLDAAGMPQPCRQVSPSYRLRVCAT